MKTKIQIKSIFGKLLFEFEKENNTIKDTVEEAVRQGASLNRASLNGACLNGASLNGASLNGASLNGASLDCASLNGASLNGASLNCASLDCASLNGASLIGAYLDGASLIGVSLKKVYNQNTILPKGELVVWKKLQNGLIAQLLIPAEAKRVNAIGSRKCRFEYAKVVAIFDGNKKVNIGYGQFDSSFIYKVGNIVHPDKFDDSPLIKCSNGIHAFITRQEAEDY